jgi:uncharacterized protein
MKTNQNEVSGRIASLDILRGFAVPGILIMNIQSFAMIGSAYINPTSYGDFTGLNKWVWILSAVFANEKFMSIFSMLFGAGVLLFISTANIKGINYKIFHYRRMLFLFIFGMLHAYLIWYGDILVAYSLCGMLVYVFRNKKPLTLIMWSALFFIVPVLINFFIGLSVLYWPQEAILEFNAEWRPESSAALSEINAMRGGWIAQMQYRVASAFWMQTFLMLWWGFWRIMAMMLLGMALFKWNVLQAQKSKHFYLKMLIIGSSTGIALCSWGVYDNFRAGWVFHYSMFWGSIHNYIGSVALALGYIAAVMLLVNSQGFQKLKKLLSNVGRMAFSNYIIMSFLGMFIFYGNGLGLFGKVERIGQLGITLAIWIVLFVFSALWLKYYKMGPLEWLWRILTYGKREEITIGKKGEQAKTH